MNSLFRNGGNTFLDHLALMGLYRAGNFPTVINFEPDFRNSTNVLLTTPSPSAQNGERPQIAIIFYFVGVTFARIGE
jgi:hypothetical protein